MILLADGRFRRTALLVLLAVLAAMLVAGCDDDSDAATDGDDAEPIAREVLGQLDSTEADGYDLHFQRLTIQPGTVLPEHYHPGFQVARIDAGELTYHILEGTAAVARDYAGEPTEYIDAPEVITLRPGDTIYELDDMEHFGENKGDEPVVLILVALVEPGKDLSIIIDP